MTEEGQLEGGGTSAERAGKIAEILDFDWKLLVRPTHSVSLPTSCIVFCPNSRSVPLSLFQYTLSSDKVEGVAKPFVRLQLVLDAGAGKKEDLLYELSDQELDQVIQEIQGILGKK